MQTGTSDSRKDWFAVGEHKKLSNEVGGSDTTLSKNVSDDMRKLLADYNGLSVTTFEDIMAFHVAFVRIHPFQAGNGRVGRLILFKECLKHNIVPFIIEDNLKLFYYRGLKERDYEKSKDVIVLNSDFKKTIEYIIAVLKDAGYNPYEQLYAYVKTGDKTYITRTGNARSLVAVLDRAKLQEYIAPYVSPRKTKD